RDAHPDRCISVSPLHLHRPSIDDVGAGGRTTPTDPRSKRNRASRRGGQVLTRARSATYKNGLPNRVRSRMPRGPDGRTVLTRPYTLNTCNGPIGGRSDIYRLSYRIPTRSRRSTARSARSYRHAAASPQRP